MKKYKNQNLTNSLHVACNPLLPLPNKTIPRTTKQFLLILSWFLDSDNFEGKKYGFIKNGKKINYSEALSQTSTYHHLPTFQKNKYELNRKRKKKTKNDPPLGKLAREAMDNFKSGVQCHKWVRSLLLNL